MMKSLRKQAVLGLFVLVGLVFGVAGTAVAQDQEQEQEQEEGQSETETLQIDPAHSSVLFRANHLNIGYVFGEFESFSGTVQYDEENPENNSIEVTIDAPSLDTNVEKRNEHLRGPDFFNVQQYPEVTFESTNVEREDDETLSVTGDLTMHGTTESITIDVKELGTGEGPQGNFRRGFYTTFNVDRNAFGIDYMPDGIGDKIKVIFAIEAVRQ